MKAILLKSNRVGGKKVKEYVKACKGSLPKIEVTLKPVCKIKGFYIEEEFLVKVRSELPWYYKFINQFVCAIVIKVFLDTFENKRKRKNDRI